MEKSNANFCEGDICFVRGGSCMYHIDKWMIKERGINWWIDHLSKKRWFDKTQTEWIIETVKNNPQYYN